MAMFDAATPQEARRRNQKKDASVVKRMERLSYMVVPNEVTFSAQWSFKKSRHIDDLDDAISLIEGESPLMLKPKPKPRGRKKALASLSTNASRPSKRRAKVSPTPRRGRQPRRAGSKPSIARIPSSANPMSLSDPFTPADDDGGDDFKYGVANIRPNKARAEFTVYEETPDIESKPSQMVSLTHSYELPVPRLTYHSAPWLQPENQNPLFFNSTFNPYRTEMPHAALDEDKENLHTAADGVEPANPLMWPSPSGFIGTLARSPSSSFDAFPGLAASSGAPDPFAYSRNPLAEAFARFGGENSSEPAKQAWNPPRRIDNPLQPRAPLTSAAAINIR
jgi:hypothetical protein